MPLSNTNPTQILVRTSFLRSVCKWLMRAAGKIICYSTAIIYLIISSTNVLAEPETFLSAKFTDSLSKEPIADILRSPEIAAFVKVGTSIGSPVPFGNIPEGATGSPVLGLLAGGSVVFPIAKKWSIQTEIQFCHYGARFTTPLNNQSYIDKVAITTPDGGVVIFDVETTFTGTATGRFSNSYIQLPVSVVYSLSAKWNLLGGVYMGWLTSTSSYANGVGQVGIRPEVVNRDMYFDSNISGIDYGLSLGVQYEITPALVLDARGTLGLTSVFDEKFKTITYSVRNTFLQLSIQYAIL